jgi:G3E family GTPase
MSDDAVPLIVLSGFLGAGKTTVLNRVLGAQQRHRLAVIVNELGRVDVDAKLLRARSGDVVELAGGCVCHEVRTQEELWGALEEVIRRSRPERIVLETTGIAEPHAILYGLDRLPPERARVAAQAVVTVVDAEAGADQLERHSEARAQVEIADRILLSKLDLAAPGSLAALHRALDALAPAVERAAFPPTAEGTAELVPWLLERPGVAGRRRPRRTPHSHGQLAAAAFSDEGAAYLPEPLLALCDRLGPALVRVKGFVHVAGESRRGFLERAGRRTELRLGDPWPAGARRTELVFIGEGLDPGALRRELWTCRATGA